MFKYKVKQNLESGEHLGALQSPPGERWGGMAFFGGKLRTEVPTSSMRSSNSGEGLFLAKNTLFCMILTTKCSHWT